jgi:transposase, IS5 family
MTASNCPHLLHRQETRLYGDSAYAGQKQTLKAAAPKAKDFTNKRAYRNKPLRERDKEVNTTKSQTRAQVKHALLLLKRLWGFAKARCAIGV